MMVAGGESTVSLLGVGGFCSARALSTRNDAGRGQSSCGTKITTGSCSAKALVLVLEECEHAKVRREDLRGTGRLAA